MDLKADAGIGEEEGGRQEKGFRIECRSRMVFAEGKLELYNDPSIRYLENKKTFLKFMLHFYHILRIP